MLTIQLGIELRSQFSIVYISFYVFYKAGWRWPFEAETCSHFKDKTYSTSFHCILFLLL